jgi:hypothetical protein
MRTYSVTIGFATKGQNLLKSEAVELAGSLSGGLVSVRNSTLHNERGIIYQAYHHEAKMYNNGVIEEREMYPYNHF